MLGSEGVVRTRASAWTASARAGALQGARHLRKRCTLKEPKRSLGEPHSKRWRDQQSAFPTGLPSCVRSGRRSGMNELSLLANAVRAADASQASDGGQFGLDHSAAPAAERGDSTPT